MEIKKEDTNKESSTDGLQEKLYQLDRQISELDKESNRLSILLQGLDDNSEVEHGELEKEIIDLKESLHDTKNTLKSNTNEIKADMKQYRKDIEEELQRNEEKMQHTKEEIWATIKDFLIVVFSVFATWLLSHFK